MVFSMGAQQAGGVQGRGASVTFERRMGGGAEEEKEERDDQGEEKL